jgi:deoxyribodipyrimidine photo-lyase
MTYEKGIWWIKRDLRLLDNPALDEALKLSKQVLPLYVLESDWLRAEDTSAFHVDAILQALEDLRQSLQQRGSDLIVMQGRVADVLTRLHQEHPFEALFSHQETGVDRASSRDREVASWCRSHGVEWHQPMQTGVFRLSDRGQRESRWRSWMNEPIGHGPERIDTPELKLGQQTPTLQELGLWLPAGARLQAVSERMGRRTLTTFLDSRGETYADSIDSPSEAEVHGSRLSVHLAWGTISPRLVWQQSRRKLRSLDDETDEVSLRWQKSLEAFRTRLHWRDHFMQRLESEPEMEFRAMHPAYRYLPLEQRHAHRYLQAWSSGQTGYPLVDAAMRCLNKTGFVNFQMRAMVVSFACHVLHLDWRSIHPHLAKVFRDYEPGIHLSQLQMQAGVSGINALRVYSPLRQLMIQDPQLRFVSEWVPELRGASLAELTLGDPSRYDYPGAIVEFGPRARQTLEQIYAIKRQEQRSRATLEVVSKHADRRKRKSVPEAS